MKGLTFIPAAALLLATPGTAQAPLDSADETTTVEELAFDKDRYERVTIPVTIAGQGPWRFFVDTGAQATVVTRRVTDALQLEPTGSARLVAMGSTKRVQTVELDDVEFANRTISGLTSPLLESDHIGADGILGLDLLQSMRVLIDFKGQRMQVAEADQPGANRGFEIVVKARRKLGQMIITDAKVDGVTTTVIIDTGAQNSVGNRALRDRLRQRTGDMFVSTDVHGVQMLNEQAMVRRMTLSAMELRSLRVGFTDSPVFEALGIDDRPALILGMGNLRMFDRVAIDFAQRKVLFDLPVGGANAPLHRTLFAPGTVPI